MSIQQRRVRQALDGLENVKLVRLKSSQATQSKCMRGKGAITVEARGPARSTGYNLFDVQTRDKKGISRWEVVARGDMADVQAALLRILR